MAGWVFRRPPDRQIRRPVVLTHAASHVVHRRRQLQALVRRFHLFRRPGPVLGRAVPAPAVHVRRRFIRPTRIDLRGRRILIPTRAQTAGHVVVTLRKPQRAALRRIQRARAPVVHGPTAQQTVSTPIGRVLKIVAQARRAMQRRLRWQPKEPLPPVFEQPHATERGGIFEGGAVEGLIQEGGGVRGGIFE